MIQQRRSFFQVTAFLGQRILLRGRRSVTWIVAISTALLCSCASLTPEQTQALATLAGMAAQVGTQIWLDKHPSHHESFRIISETVEQPMTAEEFSGYLSGLPTGTLRGPKGSLYVSDTLVVWDERKKRAVRVDRRNEQEVMMAVRVGIKMGMAHPTSPPPMPSAKSKSDADMDAEFQRYLKKPK